MSHTKEFSIQLYKRLLTNRMMEEEILEQYKLNRIPGHIHSGLGEEAVYIGTMATSKDGDYFKMSHRNVTVSNAIGVPKEVILSEIMGKATGNSGGRGGVNHVGQLEHGVLGFSGTLGSDMGVAVGAGITIDYYEKDNIVYAFYGDGTSSRGPVHEAMNMAAAWKLPILFICSNNQFAISTHVSKQTVVENPGADRAAAYGMPAKIADGTDVVAVYEAAEEMAKYVRDKKGPALLDFKTYRWRGHFEGDQAPYRDAKVTEEMRKKDCVLNMEKYLKDNDFATDKDLEAIRGEIDGEIKNAVDFAHNAPATKVEDIYENLFVSEK